MNVPVSFRVQFLCLVAVVSFSLGWLLVDRARAWIRHRELEARALERERCIAIIHALGMSDDFSGWVRVLDAIRSAKPRP